MAPGAILLRENLDLILSFLIKALWKEFLVKVQVQHVYHSDLWPAQVIAILTLELMDREKILVHSLLCMHLNFWMLMRPMPCGTQQGTYYAQ